MIRLIFRHPHYFAAAVLARFCVNLATAIWSAVVLLREDALDATRFTFYATMLHIVPEDAWAWLALILSAIGVFRLVTFRPPHWWGAMGYAAMAFFWIYLEISVLASSRPLGPASVASLTVLSVLSLFAFVSNPRPHDVAAQ